MFSSEPLYYDSAYPPIKETLPPSALGYRANNKYDGFPPLMSDGRTITATYQPEAVLNEHLLLLGLDFLILNIHTQFLHIYCLVFPLSESPYIY